MAIHFITDNRITVMNPELNVPTPDEEVNIDFLLKQKPSMMSRRSTTSSGMVVPCASSDPANWVSLP